ncbi:hypothetical protein EUX98_g8467, partial [Antrodiella citrinella]
MADSFADLWNSATPVKPVEAPKKLGALSASSTTATNFQKPANDAFSLLANTSSSASSRSVTPSYLNTPPTAAASRPNPVQKSSSSGGDAFSNILAGTLASGSTNPDKLTIAERAAQVERQRSEQLLQQHHATQKASAAWAGLDSLGKSMSTGTHTPSKVDEDDWAFDFTSPAPQASKRPTPVPKASTVLDDDDWGLGDFAAQHSTMKAQPAPIKARPPPQKASLNSLLDLDEFTSGPSQNGRKRSPEPSPHRSASQGSFDFGDHEDGLLSHRSDDEDDILGDLSKPVDQVKPVPSRSPRPPSSGQRSRAVSPPPHIIGQIVEMGFSPQQARIALASTETGLDVQAALETLISNGAAAPEPSTSRSRPRSREPTRERHRRPEEDEEDIPPRRRAGNKSMPPPRDTPSPAGADSQLNIQEQADKILAQASEIGLNMFTRANALWKQGREKVQQAYAEREQRSARGGAAPAAGRDSRPKWMQEASEEHEQEDERHDDGWGEPRRG